MRALLGGLTAFLFFLPTLSSAYTFSVSPIRVFFEPNQKTTLLTVGNDDETPLKLQVKLVSWTQTPDGKDIYSDNEDLIYYPKIMTLEPKESRVIRLGVKAAARDIEQTYRLQIEDIPGAIAPANGPAVNFRYRFSIPIFIPPKMPNRVAEIEDLTVHGGKALLHIVNRGNQHIRFDRITAKSTLGFSKDAEVWYVLPGSSRLFQIEIPRDDCIRAGSIEVTAISEGVTLNRSVTVKREDCQ